MIKKLLRDTENKILKTLIESGRELCYSEIRQICELTDPTCTKYLKKLQDGYIQKRKSKMKNEYPHPVFYKIKNDFYTFKKLANEFIENSFFHSSNYCQKMISPSLLRNIEQTWGIKQQFPSKTAFDKPDVFTEENILEILRLSPTALKKSLEDPLESTSSERFEEMLLASFILDINTRVYPNYEFKLKMSVEFQREGKEHFLKLCESRLFSVMPVEY